MTDTPKFSSGWRPIATASRDSGERILLYVPDLDGEYFIGEGRWVDEDWDEAGEGWDLKGEFIRNPRRVLADLWQPLPEPPEIEWAYKIVA